MLGNFGIPTTKMVNFSQKTRCNALEEPGRTRLGKSWKGGRASPHPRKCRHLQRGTHGPQAQRMRLLVPRCATGEASRHSESKLQQTDRRSLLQTALLGGVMSSMADVLFPGHSSAALLQFPTAQLKNNYFLVRAGEGQSEADGRVFTNPVFKTSMYSGLTPDARRQVSTQLVPTLRQMGACQEGCYIWPSINQRSYQTAEVVADQLGLSRSRIVPEYSFLDARGLGDLEGMKADAAAEIVFEGDSASPDWRPPKGSDGTPHESVSDVLVRGRQVLSICETQFRGADILIVSPDSDNLSILQAALLGVDLRQHNQFAFQPGEVRVAQLSSEPVSYGNSKFACPHPPRCTN